MMSLKIFDRILNRRLKKFHFCQARLIDIERSISISYGNVSGMTPIQFHYSNILNIMTADTYSGDVEQLRIAAQEVLHDRRLLFSLFYESVLLAYSLKFVRKIVFPKITLDAALLNRKIISRASQSGYLFIDPEAFTIKSVWLLGDLESAYSLKKKWASFFPKFNSSNVIELGHGFCEEELIVGESLARLSQCEKNKFIQMYRHHLDGVLARCDWVSFDGYLDARTAGLSDSVKHLCNDCYMKESKFMVPLIPQHGDFQYGNIIVSKEAVTIIDWEAAFFGVGFYDYFVLALGFRSGKFWSEISFDELCVYVGEARVCKEDNRMMALTLLIEEYLYRARKPHGESYEDDADQLVITKLTDLFKAAHENIVC